MDLGIEGGTKRKQNKQLNKSTPFLPLPQAQLNLNAYPNPFLISASLIFTTG